MKSCLFLFPLDASLWFILLDYFIVTQRELGVIFLPSFFPYLESHRQQASRKTVVCVLWAPHFPTEKFWLAGCLSLKVEKRALED